MRVLIFGSSSSSLRNFRAHLIETILAKGHEVHVAAPGILSDLDARVWLERINVQWHDVPLDRAGLNPWKDICSLFFLIRLMCRVRPGLFLGYTIKPVIWGGLAATLTGVPRRAALITGLGYAFTGDASGKRAFVQGLARRLYSLALRRATIVFFQNPDDKADFLKLNIISSDTPVVLVNGSGVDVHLFSSAPIPDGALRFLLVARLLGDKGVREYAAAAARLKLAWPETSFHLVGGLDSNPDSVSEEELADWVNDGSIIWHGALKDVRPAIQACHVYVLPSYREGTPRSVLEAMAVGRPIITTDAPGCRETVVDGDNGFLVPVKSVDSLVDAMTRFLESPELIGPMAKRSRVFVEEKYDVRKVSDSMISAMRL